MPDSDRRRIMIVDDDESFLSLTMDVLGTEFEAFGAVNGLDALEKVERCNPDLIILDVAMPGVDGIDTCRALRRNAQFREVPIVFLSGLDESTCAERAKGLGATHFLHKPIEPTRLLQCCRSVLQQSKSPSSTSERSHRTDRDRGSSSSEARSPAAPVSPTQVAERPRASAAEPIAVQEPKEPDTAQARARILIVDDDPQLIESMIGVLRDCFEVFGVHDPVSAIHKIIRYQPDLLIIEIAMPRMSGYQLSQLLRLNRNLKTIKILFVSPKRSPQEAAYAQKLGAAELLIKPFTAEDLLLKVTTVTEAPDFMVREKALSFDDIRRAESASPTPS
jgi:DNA-binding response OmpR family regulator